MIHKQDTILLGNRVYRAFCIELSANSKITAYRSYRIKQQKHLIVDYIKYRTLNKRVVFTN